MRIELNEDELEIIKKLLHREYMRIKDIIENTDHQPTIDEYGKMLESVAKIFNKTLIV